MSGKVGIYDDHGDDTVARFVVLGFSWLPYLVLAWGYMKLTSGPGRDFWIALGVLIALRTFFSAIEALGDVLLWRIYGRRFAVRKTLAVLQANPKR